jgi:hypothetical protein
MQKPVLLIEKLGRLPSEDQAAPETVKQYQSLLAVIQTPVADEEARLLIRLFGPDSCFGLAWTLVHLVETAPNWPLQDCLQNTENEWILLLKQRTENAR